MSQVLIFHDTNLEYIEKSINKTVGNNGLTVVSTAMTTVVNGYGTLYHTVIVVVTK